MAAIKKCEKLFPKKDKAIYVLGSTSLNCLGSSLTQALIRGIRTPNNSNETHTLCVWAEPAVLGSAKSFLEFKYEI